MKNFFKKYIAKVASNRLSKENNKRDYTQQEVDKAAEKYRLEIMYYFKDALFILLGILSAGFGLKGFLLPNEFIDGGATGISLLVRVLSGWSLSLLLILVNLPFIFLAIRTIGKTFAFKSILAIMVLAIVVHSVEYPLITDDKLLISVFGGFFLGMGIGLSIRGGAVIDGTEVLAIFLSKKTGLTIGDIILLFNIVIFSFGAYLLGIEIALYAILTYLAAAKTVDFVVDGIEEYVGVTIISGDSEAMRQMITEKLGRGCTIYLGKRGFQKKDENLEPMNIVFTVVTRLEVAKLQAEIDKIDESAFVIMGEIKDTKGGMVKKRPLK